MKLWLKKLQFKLLLYGLYLLIRLTALRSSELRKKLLEKDITLVMRTKDRAVSRTLRCHGGKVRSEKRREGDVVSFITWAGPEEGLRVMMKVAGGNPKALVKALMKKDLMPEGDASGIRWFLDIVTLLSRIYGR